MASDAAALRALAKGRAPKDCWLLRELTLGAGEGMLARDGVGWM